MERSPDVTKIAPDGTQSVYATGFWGGCFGLLFGDSGKLYVSNEYFGQIDVVTPGGGHVKTLATGLTGPKHIAFDPEGNILVAELQAGRVSSIDRKGTVTTLATGLAGPMDVEVGPDGEVYVTEVFAGRITKLTSSGPVTVSEAVPMPTGMEFHADGRLFVAAFDAEKVFTVDITDGTAAVFAAVPRPMDIHFGGSTAQARADVLGSSGIPGKGLGKAPGLQKEFNEKSAAADHAGMKK